MSLILVISEAVGRVIPHEVTDSIESVTGFMVVISSLHRRLNSKRYSVTNLTYGASVIVGVVGLAIQASIGLLAFADGFESSFSANDTIPRVSLTMALLSTLMVQIRSAHFERDYDK